MRMKCGWNELIERPPSSCMSHSICRLTGLFVRLFSVTLHVRADLFVGLPIRIGSDRVGWFYVAENAWVFILFTIVISNVIAIGFIAIVTGLRSGLKRIGECD